MEALATSIANKGSTYREFTIIKKGEVYEQGSALHTYRVRPFGHHYSCFDRIHTNVYKKDAQTRCK